MPACHSTVRPDLTGQQFGRWIAVAVLVLAVFLVASPLGTWALALALGIAFGARPRA